MTSHVITLIKLQRSLLAFLGHLVRGQTAKAFMFQYLVKIGRSHLTKTVPVTTAQPFDAFTRQIDHHLKRLGSVFDRLYELAQGGTAVDSVADAPQASTCFSAIKVGYGELSQDLNKITITKTNIFR